MSGETSDGAQVDVLKAITYPDGMKLLLDPALVHAQSANFEFVKRNAEGNPVEWRTRQEPTGNEVWDLAQSMVRLPRARRERPVEQGRRINLARRMARMPLGDEVSVENGKKKRRNSGVSAQAAHEIGTAQAPAETLEKYSNRYGVTIEWLVTGDHVGFQRNIGSFLFPKIAPLHKDMFFLKGCFPDRRTWLLNRQVIAQEGYRIISPAWLDPWLVCAVFLGTMHHEDDDVEHRTARALKDISESLKKMTDEIRYLRPRDDVEVAPDAE